MILQSHKEHLDKLEQDRNVLLDSLTNVAPEVLEALAPEDRYQFSKMLRLKVFGKLDAEIVGISSDSVESHRSYAKKHGLSFTLLSDEGDKVRKSYGVSNTLGLFAGRVTYVIYEPGVIRHVFSSQLGTKRHVEEALEILTSIGRHHGT